MATNVTFANPFTAAQAVAIGLASADIAVGTVVSVADDVAVRLSNTGYAVLTPGGSVAPVARLGGHVHVSRAGVPVFTVAAGASASAASRVDGGDGAGSISVTTTGAAAGVVCTVTYGQAFPTGITPRIFLQEADVRAAGGALYISATSNTGFTVSSQAVMAAGTSIIGFLGIVPE